MKRKLIAWITDKPLIKDAPNDYRKIWIDAMKQHSFSGKANETCVIFEGKTPSFIAGIGTADGKADEVRAVKEAMQIIYDFAKKNKFNEVEIGGISSSNIYAAQIALYDAEYHYSFKEKNNMGNNISTRISAASPLIQKKARTISSVRSFVRDIVNAPSNMKNPQKTASLIIKEIKRRKLGKKIKVNVWNKARLEKEKCGGILAVGKGSVNPPVVISFLYNPRGYRKYASIAGKGLIFDSGGLNIKTYEGMKTMKCDMAGAAAAVGTILLAALLDIKIKLQVYVGFCENMPGCGAYKPGDLIRTRSGKTIEVLNTDAEGRIVLADLLNLCSQDEPDILIDIATLTGACQVALGEETAGMFTRDEKLAKKIIIASEKTGELFWQLPLGRDYKEKMKGEISDLKNVGNRNGGASSAAEFLKTFVNTNQWVHLDIAGPAFRENKGPGRPCGATGFGVETLIEFLGSIND